MARKKKRILVICPHPEHCAPGQRLKYEQYFKHWRANAYEVVLSPFMTQRFWDIVYKPGRLPEKVFWTLWGYLKRVIDIFRLPFYDGGYIFLWVTPFGFPVFEWLYVRLFKRFVYDIDDMVFLGHVSDANKFILNLKGRSKMLYLMKKANHCIVCTPRLDEFVQQFNKRTTDISSTINTDAYVAVNPYTNERKLTLGWSGSHSTAKYLHLLDDVLREVGQEVDFRLKVIGDGTFDIDGVEVDSMHWEEATEVENLQQIDIGLYPLPNEEWVMGKSGLKALQYMSLGIPTIATDIGAHKRFIRNGENSYLVNSPEEWKETILKLAKDPELRKRLGQEAAKTVEDTYSVHANEPIYLGVLDGVFRS